MTPHERASRAMFAEIAKRGPDCWEVVRVRSANCAYDFACVLSGKYGQCWTNAAGEWVQAPRGTAPVLLAWKGEKR